MQKRAVTEANLGAWVFKVNGARWDIASAIESGQTRVETRCVADNYRKDLMRRGQRALLWVSGPASGRAPRGVWGLGWITAHSDLDPHDGWVAHTDITLLGEQDRVHATDLGEIPGVAHMEVLKLPQGSNPSWVSREELESITPLLPKWPDLAE